jgi:hypothetical protein
MNLLLLVLPLLAHAETNRTCDSTGNAGALTITITAPEGLQREKNALHIHSKGFLTSDFDAVVDKVVEDSQLQLVVEVTTLAAGGVINADSGEATITISRRIPFDGKIVLTKLPKVRAPLRLMDSYELSNCKGVI